MMILADYSLIKAFDIQKSEIRNLFTKISKLRFLQKHSDMNPQRSSNNSHRSMTRVQTSKT